MTGSSYIPIVVPIMAFVTMFFWLGLVFYADSHPGWKPRRKSAHGTAAGVDCVGADGAAGAPGVDSVADAAPAIAPGLAPAAGLGEPGHGRADGEAPVGAGRAVS